MSSDDREYERLELLRGLSIPPGYHVDWNDNWIFLNTSGDSTADLYEGWKLHISARPGSLKATVDRAAPVLFEERCNFKIVANVSRLRAFNEGMHGIGAVGKGITVFPNQQRAKEVALHLADALAGFEGPRIQSDRRLRLDAPVYYRFGPFAPRFIIDEYGYVDVAVKTPNGRMASGRAGSRYLAPDWLEDPFTGGDQCGVRLPRMDGSPIIGEHYRITSAIVRTFRGTSYRAVDIRTGHRVVIKQAVAFVNETAAGDARSYLKNEIRVLTALSGVDRVPRLLDHFAYGSDEYLVTTELGVSNLRNDVIDEGIFTSDPSSRRNVVGLGKGILRMLDAIHQCGVVVRDLAPKNVVPMFDGGWGLVDFELSRMAGIQLFGWTPGYSSKEQRDNRPATGVDDYYSLGATMFYALTGIDPVTIDEDPEINRARTLACLAAIRIRDSRVLEVTKGLLDADGDVRIGAANKLRATTCGASSPPKRSRPTLRVEPVFQNTFAMIMRLADSTLAVDPDRDAVPPSVVAHVGTAGLVAELTLHPQGMGRAAELARLTARVAENIEMPIGLLFGRMGVALALQGAARNSGDAALHLASERTLPCATDIAQEKRVDVAHGIAGLGIGYLAFAEGAANPVLAASLANECAKRLLSDEDDIEEQLQTLHVGNPAHAISTADGFAHGRAGIAYFMLAHAARTGSEDSKQRAQALMDALVGVVPRLAKGAASPKARPMCASWCQGLAGIGTALSRGAYFFGDQRYLAAARQAADGCLDIAARVPLVTQCCGLAGIGELLLDLGLITKCPTYRSHALGILSLMLTRSGGSATAPRFPGGNLVNDAPGWGTGSTGMLSFLRRLIDPATPRHWLADNRQMLPQ